MQCVREMYMFCRARNLREVWAYLWNSWYRKDMWILWARSSDPGRISCLRTTMITENHWKLLKHSDLHFFLHPRLNQTTFIIITQTVPRNIDKAHRLQHDYRTGHPGPQTTFQEVMKKEWKLLQGRNMSARDYHNDVKKWTCACGQQALQAQHLCKHLVHAAGNPPPEFFTEIHRRRVQPLYRHSFLGNIPENHDADCISDGDDYGTELRVSSSRKHHLEPKPGCSLHLSNKRARLTDADVAEIEEV
jgi:hypothetical protein